MKSKKICVLIVFFSLFAVFLTAYFIRDKTCINNKVVFLEKDMLNWRKVLLLAKNSDGGYHSIPEELNISPDLYNTFYSLKILDLLNEPLNLNDYNEIRDWSNIACNNEFLKKENNDTLSQIYFYVEILRFKNIKVAPEMKSKIFNYLTSIQNENGSFDLFKNFKGSVNNDSKQMSLISTYYATEILKYINEDPKKKEQLATWVFDMIKFKKFKSNDYLNDSSKLLLLIKISKNLNCDLSAYMNDMRSLLNTYNKCLEKEFNKKAICIPVIYINDLVELNIILKKDINNLKYINKINNYYCDLKQDNGTYSIIKGELCNILPTYMVLRYFNMCNKNIPNKDKIINLVKRNKMDKSGYIGFMNLQSNVKDTYYAYELSKIINKDVSCEVKKYLINKSKNINDFNEYELSYYLQLCNELKIGNNMLKNKKNYLTKINEKINSHTCLNSSQYVDILFLIDIMNCLEEKSTCNTNQHLKKIYSEISKKESTDEFLKVCVELKLLNMLNDKEDKNEKIKELIHAINANLNAIDKKLKLIYIYNAFKILNENNVCVSEKIKKEPILDIIYKNKLKTSTFRYNEYSTSSLESTYYAIYILHSLR